MLQPGEEVFFVAKGVQYKFSEQYLWGPEALVDSPVALYVSHLQTITDICADPWFTEQLAAGQRVKFNRHHFGECQ